MFWLFLLCAIHHQRQQNDGRSSLNYIFHGPETALQLRENIRELTISERERQTRLHNTSTAITDIKAVKLCKNHNLKDLLSK